MWVCYGMATCFVWDGLKGSGGVCGFMSDRVPKLGKQEEYLSTDPTAKEYKEALGKEFEDQ